jgi:hypothetical protein
MSLQLVWAATTGQWSAAMQAMEYPIASAATGGMRQTIDQVKAKGRSAIAAAGFGTKWQNALQAKTYPSTGISMEPAGWIYHKIAYAGIFEDGARIAGSPYLWLPTRGIPATIGGKRMTPRNFIAQIGPLHSVRAAGKPPMLAAYMQAGGRSIGKVTLAKLRAGSALGRLGVRSRRGGFGGRGVVSVPVFIGVSMVNIRARFNLRPIFRQAAADIGSAYLQNLRV